MYRKDYHVTVKHLSPIQFSRYHETPKEEKEEPGAYDRRTWREKAYYSEERSHVLITGDALTTMIMAGAHRLKKKVPGGNRALFGNVFKGGVTVASPMTIGRADAIVANTVNVSAKGISSLTGSPGTMVARTFPMLHAWGGTYRVHVWRPEITIDVLREHLEFAHMFIGLGSFRPQNGRNFGRATVVSVEEVKQVRAQ